MASKASKRLRLKRSLVILVIISVLVLIVIRSAPVVAQAPAFSVTKIFWVSSTETVQAELGDRNVDLNVVIRNTDSVTRTGVTAKLLLHGSPFTTPTGELVAVSGASEISPGTTATLAFTLNIDPAAELKTYNLVMEVESQTSRYLTGVSSSVRVPVPLYGEVKFSVSSTPETLNQGFNDFTIKITNTGEAAASDIEVSINTPETAYEGNDLPLIIVGQDNNWPFAEIKPSEEASINMKLYASNETIGKAYSLSITLYYEDDYGFDRSESIYTGLVVE